MSPVTISLLVGTCCALSAAAPCWFWARREAEVERLRSELIQARRTIMNLNVRLGNTETRVMPANMSQRLDGLWRKG